MLGEVLAVVDPEVSVLQTQEELVVLMEVVVEGVAASMVEGVVVETMMVELAEEGAQL